MSVLFVNCKLRELKNSMLGSGHISNASCSNKLEDAPNKPELIRHYTQEQQAHALEVTIGISSTHFA
jgi:hypothetical protein